MGQPIKPQVHACDIGWGVTARWQSYALCVLVGTDPFLFSPKAKFFLSRKDIEKKIFKKKKLDGTYHSLITHYISLFNTLKVFLKKGVGEGRLIWIDPHSIR